MKKTFKRLFILMAVVTVMTVCAFAMSASAADCHGTSESWQSVNIAPTCTQDGYTEKYCKFCGELVSSTEGQTPDDARVKATGHRYLVKGYELRYDEQNNPYYVRVVQCQNDMCARKNATTEEQVHIERECPTRYYLVKFVNDKESPKLGEVSNHEDYFLEGYYVSNIPATWIVDLSDSDTNDYIEKTYAPVPRVIYTTTNDFGTAITEPDYEYFVKDGANLLFVKHGSKAYADGKSAYQGVTPSRNNDTEKGGYQFDTWKAADNTDISAKEITAETTFYASFKADDNLTVSCTFKNDETQLLETINDVPYGSAVTYGGHTPTREKTAAYNYKFAGWRVEKKSADATENLIALYGPIKLYHSHAVIYAQYDNNPNKYNFELVDYKGDAFTYGGNAIIVSGIEFYEEIVSQDVIDALDLSRPNTPRLAFAETENWRISAVNGYTVANDSFRIRLNNMELPEVITVNTADGTTDILAKDYDMISLTPVYKSQLITYPVTVSIMHNYFEEEDLYDNREPRSDILDDFYVTVRDAHGNVLDSGRTDSRGKVTLHIAYSDLWVFEAVTDNGKYYGQNAIDPMVYDADGKHIYETVEFKGVGVAPSLSDRWEGGDKQSCNCICHTVLGNLLIRLYNFMYSIFRIEYVCCEDLFAVYGDILIYD